MDAFLLPWRHRCASVVRCYWQPFWCCDIPPVACSFVACWACVSRLTLDCKSFPYQVITIPDTPLAPICWLKTTLAIFLSEGTEHLLRYLVMGRGVGEDPSASEVVLVCTTVSVGIIEKMEENYHFVIGAGRTVTVPYDRDLGLAGATTTLPNMDGTHIDSDLSDDIARSVLYTARTMYLDKTIDTTTHHTSTRR